MKEVKICVRFTDDFDETSITPDTLSNAELREYINKARDELADYLEDLEEK